MLPIILDGEKRKFVLLGEGDAFERRRTMLAQADCAVAINPNAIPPSSIVFIAGLDEAKSKLYYDTAHAVGALVNTEDVLPLCDFHMPAQVRRGDLLLTVSTGGKAPGLSSVLREKLQHLFGQEWAERMKEVAARRQGWRAEGKTMSEVAAKVRLFVEQEKWIT